MPPLGAFRVFEAAARLGSFTRAAAELGMTQAAVSYQIKLLEERAGTALFRRAARGVTLSEAGARLAPVVRESLDAIRSAFAAVREEAEEVLTVSSLHTFASNWLAPRLGAFREAHPRTAVRLNAQNQLVDLLREEADAAIRAGRGPWPGLEHHLLFPVRFTPLCAPELVRRAGGLATAADLLRLPLLSPSDPWWPLWFERAGVPAPDLGDRGIRYDSQNLDGNAALAGQGVAILTPRLWLPELRAGRLVQPFELVMDDGHGYWLVYPTARRNVPKIRAFRDWLLDEASAGDGLDA